MAFQVLDPTNETAAAAAASAPRGRRRCAARPSASSPTARRGRRAISPISTACCGQEFGVANVVSRVKSNYSAPADGYIVTEIANWDAIVTGIGD